MSNYFDGVKTGDCVYMVGTGKSPWTVEAVYPREFFYARDPDKRYLAQIDYDGRVQTWPSIGQVCFWSPVKPVDPPPRPERWEKKEAEPRTRMFDNISVLELAGVPSFNIRNLRVTWEQKVPEGR